MDQKVGFQEILRRLTILDTGVVEGPAGLRLHPAGISALDPKTAELLRLAVSVALGSSVDVLAWSTARALATGASEDEITDVLLAIAPVAGLARVATAAPDVATALGYDITAALVESGDSTSSLPGKPRRMGPMRSQDTCAGQ